MTEDRPHAKASGHRTGLPKIDMLIEVREAEQRHLDGIIAVGDAESTVVAVRLAELMEQQKAAWRDWSTAVDQLTTAEKDGNAAAIAAARTRCEQAHAEFMRGVHAAIAETIPINHAEMDHLEELSDQVQRTLDADLAILDALAAQHRTPPVEGNQG